MKQILRWCVLAMSLGFACSAWAANTGRIAGKVTDAKTGEPLVGANVVVVGTARGASTDAQGDYSIANVDPGLYELRIKEVGYRDVVVREVRVRVDQTTFINVTMEETVVDIGQEVVVTAQRPLVEKDNTASRVYMESEQITARPVTQVLDLVTAIPSVNDENGVLKVRGGTLNEVSFLVDGARARNPLDQTPYTNINLGSIQEMEVITGSYNAEYGEARSGVFNIVTKEGREKYDIYADLRYSPPGVRHWGPSLYDENSSLYWENSHARHLQWWIDYPDQWVDPNGLYGNDPRSSWTPEQAYQNYLDTHEPLNDYANTPGYSAELSIGGPISLESGLFFHVSGKYRSEPPLMGNAYRDRGEFFDGTAKLTYQATQSMRILLTGFWGIENTSWGIGGGPDYFWATNYGNDSRYAYYDFPGYPTTRTWGVTGKLTNIIDQATMYEIRLSNVTATREVAPFPDDPLGYAASDAQRDNLRAYETLVDSSGNPYTQPVAGGYENRIGYNTTGYYYRYNDKNTDWTLSGYYQRQMSKDWQLKAGAEFTYYVLDHYNEAKSPTRVDDHTYNPYQGSAYAQAKIELGGFIMNPGLRYDFYNPNDVLYLDPFDPLSGPTESTAGFSQLSPRLGVSHPIDEYTVLHFSYGHFFQRATFGDYGEGNSDAQSLGNLTTFIVSGSNPLSPWVLGNRAVKPEKTIQYELGIERNFFEQVVFGVTGFYKDIRNNISVQTIDNLEGIRYTTNGNSSYSDVTGVEIYLRKQPTRESWGLIWGYANFTTQSGIVGRAGDPVLITPTGVRYAGSGDAIVYNNPRLKAGVYYQTPPDLPDLWNLVSLLSFSVDYLAVLPNDQILSDFFSYNGVNYVRGWDQNTNLRVQKDFTVGGDLLKIGIYAQIYNLFNNQWLNFAAFEACSPEEQEKFVESGFDYLPSYDRKGAPILDLAKYRNLPRSYYFGLIIEL